MEEAKIKNLIATIITDTDAFEKEYETLTKAERDYFQPYLDRLQSKEWIAKIKHYLTPEVVPPHSPPPLDRA